MLRGAMARGEIGPDTTIVESSSGNMAIGLAQACACLGLRLICVIDAKATAQHRKLLAAYGATIDVVSPADGDFLAARIARVKALVAQRADVFWPEPVREPRKRALAPADGPRDFRRHAGRLSLLRHQHVRHAPRLQRLPDRDRRVDPARGRRRDRQRDLRRHAPAAPHSRPRREPAAAARRRRPRRPHRPRLRSRLCRRVPAAGDAGGPAGRRIGRRRAERVEQMRDAIPADAMCVAILADSGERYVDTIYSDAWVAEHFGDVAHLWKS